MVLFRRTYGASPLHLLASLIALGVIYLAIHWIWVVNPTHHLNLIAWLILGAILHDAVFLPIYVILDLITRVGIGDNAMLPVRAINHIRVPLAIAGFSFLVYFPLIVGNGKENYERDLGHAPPDYFTRWVLLSVGLIAVSAVAYAIRLRRARAGARSPQPV